MPTTRKGLAGKGLISAATTAVLAGTTFGSERLQISIDDLRVAHGQSLNDSYTGSLVLSGDAPSELAAVLIDGLLEDAFMADALLSATAAIKFVDGVSQGGLIEIVAYSDESREVTTTFSAVVGAHEGTVTGDTASGWKIDGLRFTGEFSNPMFAGVDVSTWASTSSLRESFLSVAVHRDTSSIEPWADLDVYFVVPTPTALAGGSVLMLGLMGIRRRR